MEKDDENQLKDSGIDSCDTVEEYDVGVEDFIKKHYYEVEGLEYWINKNVEIRVREQVEMEFVKQLKRDLGLCVVLESMMSEHKDTSDDDDDEADMWYSSGIMTIDRALCNQFDMACELVREAKKDTILWRDDEHLGAVKTELDRIVLMTCKFQDEGRTFKMLWKKSKAILHEFKQWRSDFEDMQYDVEQMSIPSAAELKKQPSDEVQHESQSTWVTLSPPTKKSRPTKSSGK